MNRFCLDNPIEQRAGQLCEQIMLTWDPPLRGIGTPADVAQTSVMTAVAFIFGIDALPAMTTNQRLAVESGLILFSNVFRSDES
jgi:hypothetical protein